MTNETRERIKYYKDALPKMKEKLGAAIMMVVIAACVTVTATYAWTTLSTSPEVTSIETTVAANGSLEIALANGTGSAPGKSAEGDSTGAGTALTTANITWGNLINLSDTSYGLSKITLRPSGLNTSGLLTAPLYGVEYGEDGRISNRVYDEDFIFAYYDSETGKFLADVDGDHLGVRAITTVQYENVTGDNQFRQLSSATKGAYQDAGDAYLVIASNSRYINSLQGLIQLYAQSIIDGAKGSEIDVTYYMEDFYGMVNDLYSDVMIPTGNSYIYLANMLDLLNDDSLGTAGYSNVEELVAAYEAGKIPEYVTRYIPSLAEYVYDYREFQKALDTDIDYDVTYSKTTSYNLAYCKYRASINETVYWSNIEKIVDWLCQINTATLDGYKMSQLNSKSNAFSVLQNGDPHTAVLHGGAMQRIDKRIGTPYTMFMNIAVSVDVNSMLSSFAGWMQAIVKQMYPGGIVEFKEVYLITSASPRYDTTVTYELPTECSAITAMNKGTFAGSTPTAKDSYAMALDFWVRTNAGSDGSTIHEPEVETSTTTDGKEVIKTTTRTTEQAYLSLEGAVRTVTNDVAVTMKDASGNDQPAYTAEYTIGENTETMDVFKLDDGKYYYIESGKNVCLEDRMAEEEYADVSVTYTAKMTKEVEVIGYDGVNRVWDESVMPDLDEGEISTTQGGGSCYIFYADTPTDQSRFLKLLEAMKVVFVDASGNQIGYARMDTEHYFADTGRVTVPLVLEESQAINLGTDRSGKEIYGLMALKKNAATRITALVYLDGTKLTNDMVLASGDIQGSLNIQFGSTVAYKRTTVTTEDGEVVDTTVKYETGQESVAIEDEKVMSESIKISAEVTEDQFTFDASNTSGYTTELKVNITGMEPSTVSASFIRAISSTQGVLQDSVDLEPVDDNKENWSAGYTFTRPGNYILRSVWVDGVEYSLSEQIEVTVEGSSISSLSCDAITTGNSRTVLTSENSFSTKLTLGLSNSGSQPKKVKGIFVDSEGRQLNVSFQYDSQYEEWVGTANFTTSSTYTIKYIEIDGDIYELTENMQKSLEIHLGLKVRTWISASEEVLEQLKAISETATPTNFGLIDEVTLQVSAEIYDNNNNEIDTLSGAILNYQREGTTEADGRLDTNLKWNKLTGRYEGEFLISVAGNYAFSKVGFGDSSITKCTDDSPTIRCVSLKPTYYVDHSTEEYQYAPNEDAAFSVQIANAGTAGIIAKLKNTTTGEVAEVKGSEHTRITSDIPDGAGNQIITWEIDIPTDGNGSQEGVWELTSLSIYDAVYDGKFYTEDNPVELAMEDKITTDVVNYLHVTVAGTDHAFEREFMVAAEVTDMTVTVEDYAGRSMNNLTISSVEVIYDLDQSEVSLSSKDYAYSVSDSTVLSGITVKGKGNPKDGSTTEYTISGLTFNYAGPYEIESVNVSATVNGAAVRTEVFYETTTADDKVINSRAPKFDVKLIQPTVTITGTDTEMGTTFTDYVDGEYVDTQNYYEDYYANVHTHAQDYWGLKYSLPKVTLSLTNEGTIDDNNKATFGYEFICDSTTYSNTAEFGSETSAILEVGAVTDKAWTAELYATRYLLADDSNLEDGTVKVETIEISYGGKTFTLDLSNTVAIRQVAEVPPSITYAIEEFYLDVFPTAPDKVVGYDGRTLQVELPKLTLTRTERTSVGDTDIIYRYRVTTQPFTYDTGCNRTATGSKVVTEKQRIETGYFAEANVTYETSQWKIGDDLYNAETNIGISAGETLNAESKISVSKNIYGESEASSEEKGAAITTTAFYDKDGNSKAESEFLIKDYGIASTDTTYKDSDDSTTIDRPTYLPDNM